MTTFQLVKQKKPCFISKYLELLNSLNNQDFMLFRGQSDSSWPLTSTAFRRLSINRNQNLIDQRIFIEYNRDLIEKAKLNGYNKKDSRKLSDLELLAEIQHFEGATCLIDFTKNFLVALWFASVIPIENEKEKDVDGKVFIIPYQKNSDKFQRISSNDINEDIDSILKFETRKKEQTATYLPTNPRPQNFKYWIWEPEGINNRILQQDSAFIFGKTLIDKEDVLEMTISKSDKKNIQDELCTNFNISSDTLFKDLSGFASKVNSVKNRWFSSDPNDTKQVAYNIYNRGNDLYDEQDYDKALEEFSNAIKLFQNNDEFYIMRGKTLAELERFQESIEDFEKAIALNKESCKDWDLYFLIGNMYLNLKYLDQAEHYFKMSIELIPEGYFSKLGFGYIYYMKEEYSKAIDIYRDCLKSSNSGSEGQIHALIAEAEGKLKNYGKMISEFKLAFASDYSELNFNLSAFEATLIGGNKAAFNKFKEGLNKNPKKIIYPSLFKFISTVGDIVFLNQKVNIPTLINEIGIDIKKSSEKIEWSFIELKQWIQQEEIISIDKKQIINDLTEQVEKLVLEFNLNQN
jgi:tetratricopeptide (TPR) repeat protein